MCVNFEKKTSMFSRFIVRRSRIRCYLLFEHVLQSIAIYVTCRADCSKFFFLFKENAELLLCFLNFEIYNIPVTY